MPKHYKEMMVEIINKMPVDESNLRYSVKFAYKKGGKIANAFYKNKPDAEKFMKSVIAKGGKAILTTEDAPANAVAHGGVDMAPNARHPLTKSHTKYQKKNKEAENVLKDLIMKRMGTNVKEHNDNNNVVLKGVLNTLDKLDEKIDKLSGVIREEVKIVEEDRKKTIREKSKV